MKQLMTLIFTGALSVACLAQAGELTFESVDTDKNGFISVSEADSHAALKEQFKKLDADEDGQLSKEEFAGYGN